MFMFCVTLLFSILQLFIQLTYARFRKAEVSAYINFTSTYVNLQTLVCFKSFRFCNANSTEDKSIPIRLNCFKLDDIFVCKGVYLKYEFQMKDATLPSIILVGYNGLDI